MRLIIDDFKTTIDPVRMNVELCIFGRTSDKWAAQMILDAAKHDHALDVLPMGYGKTISLSWLPKESEARVLRVIYNDPATIVYWADGTKTVVKCQEGDTYDKEKGLALCFMKKMLGNKSGYFNGVLKEWLNEENK